MLEQGTNGACGSGKSSRRTASTCEWDGFVRRHGRKVTRSVARAMARVGWAARGDEVEELVQELYLRLLERGDPRAFAGRPEPQVWSYLRRIAYSVVVDQLRARHARKRGGWPSPRPERPAGAAAEGAGPWPGSREIAGRGELPEPWSRLEDGGGDDGEPIDCDARAAADAYPVPHDRPAPQSDPEERLLLLERVREVQRKVRQSFPGPLAERNLRVLELAAVEGLTAVEIADHLRGELTPSSVHTVLHRLRRVVAGGERASLAG